MRQDLLGKPAQRRAGQLLAGRVHGRVIGCGRNTVEVVGANVERAALELPAQADLSAGRQLLDEPLLVEPDRGDGVRAVLDAGRDDRQPPGWSSTAKPVGARVTIGRV